MGGAGDKPKACILCEGTREVQGRPCPQCGGLVVEVASADEVFGPKLVEPQVRSGISPRVLAAAIAVIVLLAGAIGWGVGRLNSAGAPAAPVAPGGLQQTSAPTEPALGAPSMPPTTIGVPSAPRPALESGGFRPSKQPATISLRPVSPSATRASARDGGRNTPSSIGAKGGDAPDSDQSGNMWGSAPDHDTPPAVQPGRVSSPRSSMRPQPRPNTVVSPQPPPASAQQKSGLADSHLQRIIGPAAKAGDAGDASTPVEPPAQVDPQ